MNYRLTSELELVVQSPENHCLIIGPDRKKTRCDSITAAVLLALSSGSQSMESLSNVFSGVSHKDLEVRISGLRKRGFIDEEVFPDADLDKRDSVSPDFIGWREALHYVKATWDYPFVDYSRGGQRVDRKRMEAYEGETDDVVRSLPVRGEWTCDLPSVEQALKELGEPTAKLSLLQLLKNVTAAATRPLEYMPSRTNGAPHLHRLAPSGGARHPIELYLLVIDVEGIAPGVYHSNISSGDLRRMCKLPPVEELEKNLYGAWRLGCKPRAIFLLTAHVMRNMYRYREPRTFRTLFYDAGHMGGLIEALANDSAIVAHGHHGFVDSYAAALTQSQSLAKEVPTYLVSVGIRAELEPGTKMIGRSRLKL